MSAQDAVDNTRAKQGIPNSISPNFTADQLQLVTDQINETNRPLIVTNEAGDRIGEIFQDDTYGLVLLAKAADDTSLPVTLAGSTVVLGSENTLVKFNGAQAGNFLQLGESYEVDGQILFPLTATPLDVTVHDEEVVSNVDVPLNTSFQSLITLVPTLSYLADSSVASIQFRAENSSNQAVQVEYYITVNGAAPTPDDLFTSTVPGKSGTVAGSILVSTNDSSTSLVNPGDSVTCEIRSLSGTSITITGSTFDTKLTLTQNTSIQNQLNILQDEISSTTGWAQYSDTVLTSASPQVIPQGTTSVIQNNALSVIESQLPVGVSSFYDAVNQKLTPDTMGDSYVVRVSFTAFTSSNAGALATIQLDIGGTQNIILKRGFTFPKGSGVANAIDISTTNLIYSLGTFVANGGEIQIFSEVGDTSIYDVSYVIDRAHKGRV